MLGLAGPGSELVEHLPSFLTVLGSIAAQCGLYHKG